MSARGGVGAALCVVATACGGAAAVPETPPNGTVEIDRAVAVETTTVSLPMKSAAQLYVEHDAYVYARSTGVVEAVLADLGDRVRRGRVLAQLEDVDQRIALEEAEAGLANADRLVRRFRELAGSGAVSVADSEQAELDHRRWELRVRQARRNLELTRAVAPFDGVVTGRRVRPGRLVETLDSLFRVTELRPLRAAVLLPEAAGIVAVGAGVEIVLADGSVRAATVERVAPTIDPTAGAREVIVRLADADGLAPGASVRVRIQGAPHTVLAVPRDAVSDDGFVLVRNGERIEYRRVTVGGPLPDGRVEVVSGLALGERVASPLPARP